MLRWIEVADQTLFGMTVKMYRNHIQAEESTKSIFHDLELDHYAYKHFDSEIFMYRMLDVNWDRYMEERGNVSRVEDIVVPTRLDESATIL